MSDYKPAMDPKIRLLVANWPEDSSRGAVTAFCLKHNVSRAWFYKVRKRASEQGQWEVLTPASRRPAHSPRTIAPELADMALQVRADLKIKGFDYGPLSVHAAMTRRGLKPPSRASLARIFSRAGQVVPAPRKRPRASYRRFVYPAPNCCWQLDATEVPMSGGRTAMVHQLIDDHSRLALASVAAWGETSAAALEVVQLAIFRHGIPQRFLSDNSQAFNPTRRGRRGVLVDYLTSLGVTPMTGKPGKPTTQGKNERFHQTLLRFLDSQPLPQNLEDLQELLDIFDDYYNTQRPHQALPHGMTPHEAWQATAPAPPPSPPVGASTAPQQTIRTVGHKGAVKVGATRYQLGKQYIGQTVHVLHDEHTVSLYDAQGTEITSYPRAPRHVSYVGNTTRSNAPTQVSTP